MILQSAKIPHYIFLALLIVVGILSLIVIDRPAQEFSSPTLDTSKESAVKELSLHQSSDNCWTMINGELYEITEYIPLHPGGTSAIEQACGVDATELFATKGGGGSDHSSFAYNLLSQMRIRFENETNQPSSPNNGQINVTSPSNNDDSQSNPSCFGNEISTHDTASDCWIIVNDVVYDVSSYISVHPGGVSAITDVCGAEASTAFLTKGGTGSHSSLATNLLQGFKIGELCKFPETNIPPISATIISPSLDQIFPSGTSEVMVSVSTNVDAICRWSTQNREYTLMNKEFDTTGSKVHTHTLRGLSDGDTGWMYVRCAQSPTNVMTKNSKISFTIAEVVDLGVLTLETIATHSSASDCWIIVDGNVYDVTSYIPMHPGGSSAIRNECGTDASVAFDTRGGTGSHSSFAHSLLDSYSVGTLGEALPLITPVTATITSPSASQQFASGTTAVTLSATTNIASTCRWSNSNQAYSSMSNTFSSTGGTSHSTSVSGLSDGVSRTVYVRCSAASDNVMSSSISRSFSVSTPTTATLSATVVATHSTSSDCWIIVSDNVYDVSSYIPLHPGGQTRIINTCGSDATTAFVTRGGGSSHSQTAYNLLAGYLLGPLDGTAPTVTPIIATITSPSASQQFASGTTAVTLSATTNIAVTCRWSTSNQAYSSMSNTFSSTGGTSHSTSVSGLTDGVSRTVYVRCLESADNVMTSSVSRTFSVRNPTSTTVDLTAIEVANHASSNDCWIIVNANVYDVTSYIPMHPGGQSRIINTCGSDATTAFVTRGGGSSHSQTAYNLLANYNLGPLGSSTNSTDGGGDTGGGTSIPTIQEAIEARFPGATITDINEEDDGRAEVKIRYEGESYTVKLNAQHEITDIE